MYLKIKNLNCPNTLISNTVLTQVWMRISWILYLLYLLEKEASTKLYRSKTNILKEIHNNKWFQMNRFLNKFLNKNNLMNQNKLYLKTLKIKNYYKQINNYFKEKIQWKISLQVMHKHIKVDILRALHRMCMILHMKRKEIHRHQATKWT